MVAAAAIIASSALPPSRNTATADSLASECGAVAMPRVAREVWIATMKVLERCTPQLTGSAG
jgi:hypothetical protein